MAAEKSANESSEALKNLKADLTAVELDYFQIGKDVNRSVAVADAAKRKAQAAHDNRELLSSMYNQATTLLNERTGASEGTQTRAEQLKKKASTLLEKTLKHIAEIERKCCLPHSCSAIGGGTVFTFQFWQHDLWFHILV